MQSRFRKLSCTAVGGADAERFSIGAEEVNYEGPLQLRLQVKLPDNSGAPHQAHRTGAAAPLTAIDTALVC
jgi:hypothetical protein